MEVSQGGAKENPQGMSEEEFAEGLWEAMRRESVKEARHRGDLQ